MNDRYLTIAQASLKEIKVKGSRFIARTDLAESVVEADRHLQKIRNLEYAASHNCYAFIIGAPADKATFKYSDDGEPNGTAGRPIYDVIKGRGVTNIVLVVTRYFGGTKLGTGGLVKAYSEAASLALDKSGARENFVTDHLRVEIEFSIYDSIKKVAHRLGATETQADYSDRVALQYKIRKSKTAQFMAEITELSKGQAKIEKDG
jgi:uncharacterized YigZ family protein